MIHEQEADRLLLVMRLHLSELLLLPRIPVVKVAQKVLLREARLPVEAARIHGGTKALDHSAGDAEVVVGERGARALGDHLPTLPEIETQRLRADPHLPIQPTVLRHRLLRRSNNLQNHMCHRIGDQKLLRHGKKKTRDACGNYRWKTSFKS